MRIPLNVSARTFFWLAGGLFLFVGLGLLYGGIQEATQERAYREEGQAVEALVVSKSIHRASRDGNSSTKYEITYRFTTTEGRTLEGIDAVTVDEWERLEPGSAFRITYLPGTPETSRAEGAGGMASAYGMMGLGSLLALVGGFFLVSSLRRLLKERRLLRHGMTAQAAVVAIEPSDFAVNRVRQWNVRYRYQDHLGQRQEGTSSPLPPDQAHAVRVGDTVEVRFDSERPGESVWVRSTSEGRPSLWKRLQPIAVILGVLFVALVVGESVPALKALDRLAAQHEFWLTAITVGMTVVGFLLFMGGILYRIFGPDGEPMTHTEVEDLSRNVGIDSRPVAARVSAYRFRGRSAGTSFGEGFDLREAKEAWRQRAWRTSPRWRANFVVTAGALLFIVGLFGFFVVGAPAGIKLLYVAVILYAAARLIVACTRTEVR
jgi:uncharacterized protein DUF3592